MVSQGENGWGLISDLGHLIILEGTPQKSGEIWNQKILIVKVYIIQQPQNPEKGKLGAWLLFDRHHGRGQVFPFLTPPFQIDTGIME